MSSVFRTAMDKATLLKCEGYDPMFMNELTTIGYTNILSTKLKKKLPKVEGNTEGIIHYSNLSVLYNTKRRVPFVSAYNVDGSSKLKVVRNETFVADPRIEDSIQLSQKGFYDLITNMVEFEIGHMAANNEMAWGSDAQVQSYQTFHFPNSAPQARNLNTGIWHSLETYIINEAAALAGNKKICVFTGPVLMDNDPEYVKDSTFQIPLLFYKVIVFSSKKGIYSTAFMMSHEQKMIEQKMFIQKPAIDNARFDLVGPAPNFTDFKYKKVFQVNIKYLEAASGLKFSWKGVKTIKVPADKNQVKKILEITNKDDAGKAEQLLRNGIVPVGLEVEEEMPGEEIIKHYRLNIILP